MDSMKWYRMFLAVTVIGFLSACESPTVPRYPDPEDNTDTEDPDPPPTQGSLLSDQPVYWV